MLTSWSLFLCGFLPLMHSALGSDLLEFSEGSAELPEASDTGLCPEGTYFSHQLCLECPAGHFCSGNVSAPQRCPTGTFNPNTRRSTIRDCQLCFPGLISSDDKAECRLCPAGFSCLLDNGRFSLCPPGKHSPEGILQCLTCPIDSVCTSGFAHKCGPGKEPNSEQTVCQDCHPGFYSSGCSIQCLPCPAGGYCPHNGMSEPITCPPGWTSSPGQTYCSGCNDTSVQCGGALPPRWSLSGQRSGVPLLCRPGTYKPPSAAEESRCAICPAGHYCVGGIAVPCPAGTYSSQEGLQKLTDCTICPAGFYCLESSSEKPGSQFLCPRGYYCEEGTATMHGSPCPPGTAGEQLGQTSRASCKRCKEGRFCPAGSTGPGLPCARGRYCPAGTTEEVICPQGTFTPHQGAIGIKDCLRCPAGFYCPEGTSNPVPCPPGTYNPIEGQDELSDCRECNAGKACTQVALRAPDVDCMQGFVCPLGSTKPNLPTNACPAGTLSNRTDLTHRSQCQMCPSRYACLRGTGGPQRPPLSCFAGHYCPPGSKFPTQFKCPVGTWSGQSGLESESECQPCPTGWYCLAGSGSPSGRCSSGHYCPAGINTDDGPTGTAYGTQFPCPAGTYSIHMGNRQKEDCLICPDGSFCREGTSKPSPCPPSTFRRQKGGQTPEDCSACPAGYFCSRSATVNPRVCGTGSFSDEGSVECSPCLPGYYCSNETTSEEAMLSIMVCPPGFLCSQGLSRDPQRSATLCPVGFFCPGGGIDPNPVPCPNGTYGETPGLQNVAQCRPCPAGMYCYAERPLEQPITRPTGVCPDGHYCPSGTGYPQTYPCQAGFYSNISVGHGGKECVLCPAQHYCERPGVHTPARCPQGFFCPVGTSRPHPCPEGTYNSRYALSNESECTPCGGGQYCSGVGLSEPSGGCQERFYCREGAKSATPIDGSTGGLCPAGSFCPPASSAPFPCPPGSFSNNTGLIKPQDCTSCPPGFYCSGSGNTAPSGPCYPGFYCSGGASSPVQFEAGEGHYALGGAVRAEPCPLGTFQSSQGAQSCVECLRGRLCNRTGLFLPPLCPPGHYCPPGTSVAHPCPPGSYLDQSGADDVQHCRQCEAGWFCNGAGLSAPRGLCEPGHYCTAGASTPTPVDMASGGVCPEGYACPRGTKFPHQHPCPPGTWSSSAGAHNLTCCQTCPPGRYCSGAGLTEPSGACDAGFFCIQGARTSAPSDGVTGNICPAGHYCFKGSSFPRVCPDGTFSNSTGAVACDDCPPGTYCLPGEGVRPCPAGHFCLGGGVEAILPCPPGTYSPQIGLSQVEQCLICPAGFYCEDWGLFEPTGPCQAGYYCTAGVNFQRPDGNFSTGVGGACPRGKYCPEGTGLPIPCPPGTYSDSLHLTDSSGCSSCPGGMFCSGSGLTSPTGICVAGFYCPGGDSSATGSEGDVCPPAHYCPEGSLSPIPCPAGSFANRTGHSVCLRCPAGYYCPEKTQSFIKFPCPPGFYCPDGTRHATQYPCPRGYYNPEPMTQSLDSCLPCPPGHYCEKERLTKASGKCKGGWFCVSAAWNSQPFDLDNYTNANCLCPATSTGGRCQAGFYCPSGSSEPIPCPPGAFCNISGLALPMGPCSAGFYCTGEATDARPTDGKTGDVCPPGTFCVEGSGEPELCPAGTFSPTPGLTGEAGCRLCTAGFYCGEPGLKAPTGPCNVGYWCPSGQSLATALPCPVGHFCPRGTSSPRPCPPGTYQDRESQESCSLCGAGFYCDPMTSQNNFSRPELCPTGHYCPLGTSAPKQHPCPKGTFNPRQQSESVADCLLCSTGEFCPSVGLPQPVGACHAGYWCRTGASSPTPLDGLTGSLCPAGHFCPSGALTPEACPEGSWSNSSGLRGKGDCRPCPGGYFCDSRGLASPTGPCRGGYYCLSGASSSAPTDGVTGGPCPEGHYCPEGTVQPLLCHPGTYTVITHATRCEPCMAGWHCPSGSLYLCPAGFFCPEGTGLDLQRCPMGTYGPDPGYSSVSQCRRCDGGHYCSSRNATAVTGPCQEGYYCSRGNSSPHPNAAAAEEGGPCPVGHYCPEATVNPSPCPLGTFSNLTKLVSKDECQPCLPGYYCDAVGLLAPAGKCRAGFFCLEGANRPDPPVNDGHGGPCPKGYYCSEGSPAPQPCPAGAISAEDGRPSCSTCPPGFYCPGGFNGSLNECPVGHYCPPGTWSKHQHPCPAGFINPNAQMATPLDCLRCPPGLFCASPGMSVASGPCGAGYYCLSGARSPTPSDGGTGDSCPEGHYCPQGSSSPLPCPKGYYSNTTGNSAPSDCLPCPPGYLCFSRGLPFPSQVCSAGSFCPGGSDGSAASIACSVGNMCPAGSSKEVPCPLGTYQNLPGQEECARCPAGFYCDGSADSDIGRLSGTKHPTPCPKGHFCPPGAESAVAFPCPAGTFSGQMGLSNISGCEPCPPGSYCGSFGLSAPTGPCSPGYLCLLSSLSSQPEDGATGGRCAAGSYCPLGAGYMVPCPAGTFSSLRGAVNLDACQLCLPGHYCAEDGLSSPSGRCKPGFFCIVGSPTATPLWNITDDTTFSSSNSTLGRYHGDVCPAGHFCSEGSEKPSPCPPGTFQGKQGAASGMDCKPCYPGFYCPFWAQMSVDHLCPPGWFCRQGSASGRQPGFQCNPGYACPPGSAEPVVCRPGTFQLSFGETTCDICPAGFYCTEGTAAPHPCPVGTFSPLTGRTSLRDCIVCTSGFFCNASAITEPSGPCSRGHFCSLGSAESNPIARPYGDVCPVGHFCPLGIGSPKPCPVGSFLSVTGAFSPNHCKPCLPGRYCRSQGAAQPTGPCAGGFFCSTGSDSSTPSTAPAFFHCLHEVLRVYSTTDDILSMLNHSHFSSSSTTRTEGDRVPATYSDHTVTHLTRPESTQYGCNAYKGDICPRGFYCPLASAYPVLCEPGFYCNQSGLERPAGRCDAGFYCPKGSSSPTAHPCPAGHYCPPGAPLPVPCPLGTIQRSVGGSTAEDCLPCPPGRYCDQRGLLEPGGQCSEGFYCPGGQSTEQPLEHLCSPGHYCAKGSVSPSACPPGTYQPTAGQASCDPCPAGFFCQSLGMTLPHRCVEGFYCPSESADQHPCPSGTYGNLTGMFAEWQCLLCDPGMYCSGTGKTAPSGQCAAGFVCVGGASEPSPSDGRTGFPCPPGFFCCVGTSVPQPCPKGTFSEKSGLSDVSQCQTCRQGFYCAETGLSTVSGPCLAGFYCLEGSRTAAPVSGPSGSLCPIGHYCAEGSSVASPCPAGSYQNETGGKAEEDCKPCPLGFFQDLSGQKECNPCPPGFHCLSQSLSPSRVSSTGLSIPLPCPAGYICPRENPDSRPLPCPKGTYSPTLGLSSSGECLLCPAGSFCGSEGLAEPTGACAPGFICLAGATVPNPNDNSTGSLCPPGFFCKLGHVAGDCWAGYYCDCGSSRPDQSLCPAGFFCPVKTPAPVPCPAGTFSFVAGNIHEDNCTTCSPGYYCPVKGTVEAILCPAGHYCPPGLVQGKRFPCPVGTMNPHLGVFSPNACVPCPSGMFCSQPGQSQPTGPCEAGFYCPAGSSRSHSTEDQDNSTQTLVCPAGHYCPQGTGAPLPCLAGSLSSSRGLKRLDECLSCLPGRFCSQPGMTDLSEAPPCDAGYVCLSGSPSPTPSDGSHGYLCPAGHNCPVGSATEVPCEPGTYSPAPGAAECSVCPSGTMCSSFATREPLICPAGHFCPAGTALPLPCPLGTLSNGTGANTLTACAACPAGVFCNTLGALTPQGNCLQGYFCQGGAKAPAPQSSENFPLNGPCPVGHYCPEGCLAPIPCPFGSVRNTTGGVSVESCLNCPAGHYCSSEGLVNPNGPCAAGFFCPFDFSSTTPYAFLCLKGHYCPTGSPMALPCPTGEYQPNPGSDRCIPCRPGFYCEEAVVGDPHLCPAHSFCPAATMVPHPCPDGTYTPPNKTGLRDEKECSPCPPGKFCRAGRIQGVCAAGYLCLSGSADFIPQGPISNVSRCQQGVPCAGPCPPGFYCPEGTEVPQICPENTFRAFPGAANLLDCLACPPKHWCKQGDPFLHLCPAGHYCDGLPGNDFNGVTGPIPCPQHTYRASPGAGSKAECLPCPLGFHCNNTGLSDYASAPCPPGYWCSGVGSPVLCPAGTKRSTPGAGSPSHCEPCGGGTFCPDPTATGKPNVDGIPCRASYQCPTGAASERLCRAGSYCGPQTAEPQMCPEGYICPEGSDSYNAPKQLCPFPYYCPANSSAMKSCNEGTVPVHISGPRGSRNSSCALCEGGTYRPYLSPNLQCLHCPAGYFCPAGTGDYKRSPCPSGYVCPGGSDRPNPCPPGSFGNITNAKSANDCHACPTNTFNHLPGQRACFPCGSSSTSPPGSSSCSCLGKNRAFHHSDGLCLCRTGFIYYNELDFKSSASDSEVDCQPEMNRRCATGEVRLAASRECVSPTLHSCNRACGPHGGTLNAEMGICQCAKYVSAEELCNTSCLSRLPQLAAQSAPDGSLLLSIKDRGAAVWARTVLNVLGPDVHAKNIWKTHLVQFDSEGIFGWIPAHKDAIDRYLSEGLNSRKRRDIHNEGDDSLPRIPNPIVCLSVDDMLLFHLAINHSDRHLSHFPVYYKDHLFNSNPGWDFGVFRQLETLITQTNLNSTMFAHVFSERGKYVFVDGSVPEWSLVVVVSEEGTECDPRTTAFQPMTPSQLVRYGVVKQHRLNLQPNWDVITGVLCLLLVLVVVLTTMVLVLRPNKVTLVTPWKSRPKWRSLGEPIRPVECVCSRESLVVPNFCPPLTSRGVGEGAEAEEHSVSKGGSALKFSDLEEFNVKTLYDKLEDQNLHIASQLARHRKDAQEFYRNICQQVETLQNFFENMDHKKLGLLKELLVHNAMMEKPKQDCQAEASAALLEAVLRSVEVLLCRLSLETEMTVPTHAHAGVVGDSELQNRSADTHMSDTQRSSVTKAETLPQEHSFPKSSCLSDQDLSKLVSASPLYKTLLEIQDYLKNVSSADPFQLPCDGGQTVEENHATPLIPTALDKLSPQHSAIFLFGCQVMELLSSCPQFPSVLLLLAKSIPVSSALSKGLLAHCSGDCYFDATNQILYILEAKLQNAGHFIAAIVQSMACVASGFQTSGYLLSLHEAISALSLQLFFCSKWSTTECKSGASHWSCGALVEEFLNIRAPTEEHFTAQQMAARLEKYKYFTLEQLISNFKETSTEDGQKGRTPRGTPLQISSIEEEIDRMNESFVRLSVELQERAHLKVKQNEEGDDGNHLTGATPVSTPCWSHDGTALLELKRRYISQRLNELQITLSQLAESQHRDDKSEDMRNCVQTDGAQKEQLPGIDGCCRLIDPCQDDISGRGSRSQREESKGPGNLSGGYCQTPEVDTEPDDIG